jgi:hypothetical protein
MARTSNDPLANLAPTKDMDNAALIQLVKDQHEHMVLMQREINSLQGMVLQLQEATPDISVPSFHSKVWETVMMGALSASLGPNKVIQDTPKAMQQMIGRALRLADAGVEAAKAYQKDQEQQRKDKEVVSNNDPLKQLLQ